MNQANSPPALEKDQHSLKKLPNSIRIGDKPYHIAEKKHDGYIVEAELFLTSLIINTSASSSDFTVLAEEHGLKHLRHGMNTYSLLSDDGGWVIAGPSKHYILGILENVTTFESILGTANVETQWLFSKIKLNEATGRMAQIICKLIPAFDTMSRDRQDEVRKDFHRLCYEFASLGETNQDRLHSGNILWDVTPGLIMIPKAVSEGKPTFVSLEDVEGSDVTHSLLFNNLKYWWESAFIAWWKGFW